MKFFGGVFTNSSSVDGIEPIEGATSVVGCINERGALRFSDQRGAEPWRLVMRVDFNRANDAFFTAWSVEKSFSEYRGGRVYYPLKAIVT